MKLPKLSQYIRVLLGTVNRRWRAILFGLIAGFGVLFLVQLWQLGQHLYGLGPEGDHQAQVWGLPVEILSTLQGPVGFLATFWLYRKRSPVDHIVETPTQKESPKPAFTWLNGIVATICALLAFFVPQGINRLAFDHWEKQIITNKIQLSHNSYMKDGSTARAILPATEHRHLKIKFRFESQTASGSCVAPALLTIVPTSNGSDGKKVSEVRSGTWQDVELGTMADKRILELTLDLAEEPYCTLKLNIDSAFYSR